MSTEANAYDRSPFMAEFYDYIEPLATRSDIAFYVGAARDCGGPILELGCGTGRILAPTARAGIEASGLDGSQYMLAACRRRVAGEAVDVQRRINLYCGDMRAFDLARRFRLITLPFRLFQYLLTVEEQLACLAAVRRHVEPNGSVILDVAEPSIHRLASPLDATELVAEEASTLSDGRRIICRHRNVDRDLCSQTFSTELAFHVTHPNGRSENFAHQHRFRYFFRFELEHLLARAGFAITDVYSGFDRCPYGSTYPGDLIFIARPELKSPAVHVC
jgi:SAM-dependent methyltransferase